LFPDTTSSWWGFPFDEYGVIHLGPGDTLQVIATIGWCGSYGTLTMDGVQNVPFGPGQLAKCTTPGSYEGVNCDDGCNGAFFTIAPLAGAIGSVALFPMVRLGGAMLPDPSVQMRTTLKAQGLLPVVEPYSALGCVHTGGGGGEVLGPIASTWYPVVDWVIVELRSPSDPNTVMASKAALLAQDGRIVDALTTSPLRWTLPPGYYHVAVKQRNHLGVMTATPVLLCGEASVVVNFLMSTIATYGTEAQEHRTHQYGNYECLWPGNANWTSSPTQIKYAGANNDRDAVLTRIGGTTSTATSNGYFNEDVNLDGVAKYAGADNDRDVILQTIGGVVPTVVRSEQMP
jgi:hypothetical protein